jgi:hypothetical protein
MDLLERIVFWTVLALVGFFWLFGGAWALQHGRPLVGLLLLSAGTFAAFTGFVTAQRGKVARVVLAQWAGLFVLVAVLWVAVAASQLLGR